MFILASSVRKPFQCLNSTLTQGGKDGHLFRHTSSVVWWGGRDTANKYHRCVWGVFALYGLHWVCHSSRRHVLPRSTLLRLQGTLQGHYPQVDSPFHALPRSKLLRFSGTPQGHRPGWACILCPSQVRVVQATRCLVSSPSQVGRAS